MAAGSSYTQLSSYLVMEYIYGDSGSKYLATQYKPARVQNAYDSSQYTFINTAPARSFSNNVLNTTAVPLGGSNWVSLETDVPVPYLNQDSRIVYTDLGATLSSLDITYDTVRFHLQSGYNLDDIEGLIFQVFVNEAQSGLISYLTSNFILKGGSGITLNPTPLFLTDRVYDKYVEIVIPSLNYANQAYYADPGNVYSLGYQYTTDHRGYDFTSNIYVRMYEITSVAYSSLVPFFSTSQTYQTVIRQYDIYSDVAAVIQESTGGDYFEYYISYQGNFPEQLIENLNAQGGNYVILHQISVVEQVGTDFIVTNSYTQMQNSNYNEPVTFRPILKYAGSSPSFSIDYTGTVYNMETGYQIIKTASITSFNPNRYGANLERIALSNLTSPLAVYNQVSGGATINYSSTLPTNNFTTVYIPVFFDSKTLFTGTMNVLAPGQSPLDPQFNSNSLYYAQGAARLYLGNFDQYFKFDLKQYVSSTNTLNDIDLSKMTISIGFADSTGAIFTYPSLPATVENPATSGNVLFLVPAEAYKRIGLNGSNLSSFYILATAPSFNQTKLYQGTVDSDVNIANENARVQALGNQATTIQALTASMTASGATGGSANSSNASTAVSQPNTTTPSISSQLASISNTSIAGGTAAAQVPPPVVPGFSTVTSASNLNSIVPTGK
jgi:hypothetical protein